jgi:homoserine kinase
MASRSIGSIASVLRRTTPTLHLGNRSLLPISRTMSSSSSSSAAAAAAAPGARKFEWLVVVTDKPGMLQKRFEVRP